MSFLTCVQKVWSLFLLETEGTAGAWKVGCAVEHASERAGGGGGLGGKEESFLPFRVPFRVSGGVFCSGEGVKKFHPPSFRVC